MELCCSLPSPSSFSGSPTQVQPFPTFLFAWEKQIVNKYPVVPKGEAKHGIGHWMLLYFISLMSEKLTSQVGSPETASLRGSHSMQPRRRTQFHQEPQDCCRSERLTVYQTHKSWKNEKRVRWPISLFPALTKSSGKPTCRGKVHG